MLVMKISQTNENKYFHHEFEYSNSRSLQVIENKNDEYSR